MTFALVSVGVILASMLYEIFLRVRWRTFPALVLLVAAGLTGLFLTGDAFNFYVFFEISMTAALILAGYREEDYQIRAAFVFAVVNLLGSVVFLIGIAPLYSVTGSLDMDVISESAGLLAPSSVIAIAALIFAAFCLKLGLFPFHFWLPAVYVGSHAPVAAILSGALANIGAYGLLRFGAGVLPRELELGAPAVMAIGAASIAYGSLQAVSRRDTSEVMAYSAIGQAGYVLLALGVGGPVGYAAAVVYAVVNSLNKGVVFLAAGLRGPLVGAAFAVGAFSVAGVPPAAGFLGKLTVIEPCLTVGSVPTAVTLVALVFLGSTLSFLYSFQVYQRRLMRPGSEGEPSPRAARLLVGALAALVLLVGLWPEPLALLSEAAAAALTSGGPGMTRYVAAVALLTLVYALALASFGPLDLLFGALLSAALVFFSRGFVFGEDSGRGPSVLGRAVAFVPFALEVFREILRGTWEISLVTLHLRPLAQPGIVAVSIADRTPSGVSAWAVVTGLPPGSFFVDVDEERGVALIHILDASDPEAFREEQEDLYRRYQSKVFP